MDVKVPDQNLGRLLNMTFQGERASDQVDGLGVSSLQSLSLTGKAQCGGWQVHSQRQSGEALQQVYVAGRQREGPLVGRQGL